MAKSLVGALSAKSVALVRCSKSIRTTNRYKKKKKKKGLIATYLLYQDILYAMMAEPGRVNIIVYFNPRVNYY